jgi:hypothetical protein
MAKTKPKAARKASEEVLGQTREELLRDLRLDQLTREACLRGVFGGLLDEPEPGMDEPEPGMDEPAPGADEWTVTQVGPGRRAAG